MESVEYLLYLHGAFISWRVASLHYTGLTHAFIPILKQLRIPKEKENTDNAYLPIWVFRIGNKD